MRLPKFACSAYCALSLCLFCALHTIVAQAQNPTFVRQNQVPVEHYTNNLPFAWLGGLNNPQFSEADLNNDLINDLFVFDRNGNQVIALLNSGTFNETDYN